MDARGEVKGEEGGRVDDVTMPGPKFLGIQREIVTGARGFEKYGNTVKLGRVYLRKTSASTCAPGRCATHSSDQNQQQARHVVRTTYARVEGKIT